MAAPLAPGLGTWCLGRPNSQANQGAAATLYSKFNRERDIPLVTGGAGFIGSFLVDALLAAGHGVRVLDSLDPEVHPLGPPAYLAAAADLRVGDTRDRAACAAALDGVDAVVHAAAAVGVGQSLYRGEHYVDVNVRGTATLLGCLADRKAPLRKLVVLTSMTGYGEGLYRRPSDGHRLRVGLRTETDIRRAGWEPRCPDTGERIEPVPTPEEADLLARNVYALTSDTRRIWPSRSARCTGGRWSVSGCSTCTGPGNPSPSS